MLGGVGGGGVGLGPWTSISSRGVIIFLVTSCESIHCLYLDLCTVFHQFTSIYVLFFFPDNGTTIQEKLKELSGQRTVPNVFIRGKHVGGFDDVTKLQADGKLMELIVPPPSENYTYDLIVIGGGSGGLACSKVLVTAQRQLPQESSLKEAPYVGFLTPRDLMHELRDSKACACSNSDLGEVLFYEVIFWDSKWRTLE